MGTFLLDCQQARFGGKRHPIFAGNFENVVGKFPGFNVPKYVG